MQNISYVWGQWGIFFFSPTESYSYQTLKENCDGLPTPKVTSPNRPAFL